MNELGTYGSAPGVGMQAREHLPLVDVSQALQRAIQRLGQASIRCGETTDPELLAHRAEVLSEAAGECARVAYAFKGAAFREATKE